MNDSELDAKLKAAFEPALPAQYRAEFTQQVLANLRSSPWKPAPARRKSWLRLAWGLATVGCVLLAFLVGRWHGQHEVSTGKDLLANVKLIEETMSLFPDRVRAIVQDGHGLKLVLADQPDVPASTPIYVRICDGKNCSSLVTFSGQEIQVGGQKLTVLSQPDGGIILEGNRFVWSSTQPVYANSKMKIEARNLNL